MRVAHVSASMDFGGAERMLADLAATQAAAGLQVTIIAPPGRLDRDWPALGVDRVLVPAADRRPWAVVRMAGAVGRAVRRAAPDVVHAHNVKAAGIALTASAPRRRRRVLVTMHGVAAADLRGAVAVLRFADLVATVSEGVRDEVVARGLPAERVCVVRNGIGPGPPVDAAVRAAYTAELGLGSEVVTAVGRLVPQKAHHRFLEAAAEVLARRPQATFLLVGDGPLRADLQAQARAMGIEAAVRFTGARTDARTLIGLSDLVVFSSEWEGLSIAALEALASGVPLVTTDVAGMRELLGGGAGEIVGFSAAELAAAIDRLLADPERRRQMGELARELIERDFSLATMSGAYLDAYRRVAGDADARR